MKGGRLSALFHSYLCGRIAAEWLIIMLKLKDILAAANAKVAEYMAQGYMISWMNASFGYKFRVDLEKNGDCVRVKVDSFHNWECASSIGGLSLQVVRIARADTFEDRDVEPLYSKNFYDLSRYGRGQAFTESLEEKQAACEKVIARYLASDRDTRTELQPSAALIRQLKQRKGFTNATRNNIRVYRCVAGYTIEMAGRNGAKAKSELIRLPGTK